MQFGLDFLGLAKYANIARREFPKGWALGAFAETFGDAFPAIDSILATGRCPIVRIQLIWDDQHNYGDQYIPKIKELAPRANELAKKFPNVSVLVSPFCEHNIPNPEKYLALTQKLAPKCETINSIWKGGISNNFRTEIHGQHARIKPSKKYLYSYDGTAAVDADVKRINLEHERAGIQFLWTYQFNGKKNSNDTTPRPDRQAWPTSELIDSVIYLHNKKGHTTMPKGWIWKSHADQHNAPKPEPRALKPVLIASEKRDEFLLVADNGQVVATLPYYGPFQSGFHRYYLGRFGFEVAEKAIRIQGHPVCKLMANNSKNAEVFGKINPAFRDGVYR